MKLQKDIDRIAALYRASVLQGPLIYCIKKMDRVHRFNHRSIRKNKLQLIGLEMTDEMPLDIRWHLRDFRCKLLRPILSENPLPCGIGLLKSRDRVKFGNCHKAHTLWQFRKN